LAISGISKRFRGKKELAEAKTHTAHFGHLVNDMGNIVDDVVCTIYKAPQSYTGEDVVEISCHGGTFITKKVYECIIGKDVRPAKPGEFSLRAFINGKLDLTQAEAVADLIQSKSEKGRQISLRQLNGELSKKIYSLRSQLVQLIALLELELDFAEDDIELIDKKEIYVQIKYVIDEIENLLQTYQLGKVCKEGVRITLVGPPNVGKSSLMNAILREERAIVTEIPGTTRDFIEEQYTHDGVLYILIDTAGLRSTNDTVEIEGIKRTWMLIEQSDVVVFVHDKTMEVEERERKILEEIKQRINKGGNLIIVNNKADLISTNNEITEIEEAVSTSAKSMYGIESLVKKISHTVFKHETAETMESLTITNVRHFMALTVAKERLIAARESVKNGKSEEFIALDLRSALDSIGEIVGLVTTEDILNEVFSKFCIGK